MPSNLRAFRCFVFDGVFYCFVAVVAVLGAFSLHFAHTLSACIVKVVTFSVSESRNVCAHECDDDNAFRFENHTLSTLDKKNATIFAGQHVPVRKTTWTFTHDSLEISVQLFVVFRNIIYFDINVRCANIFYNSPALFSLSVSLSPVDLWHFAWTWILWICSTKNIAHFSARTDPSISPSIVLWNLNRATSVAIFIARRSVAPRAVCVPPAAQWCLNWSTPTYIAVTYLQERCKCEMIEQNLLLSPKNCHLMGAAH